MMMESDKMFKTKTGFCHILPDKIVLTRNGLRGDLAVVAAGSNIARLLITYTGLATVLFYVAYTAFRHGDTGEAIFFGALGAFLLLGVLRSLNNSATPVIERSSIQSVRFVRGFTGLTRSRFEVRFANEKGQIKKRLIMLPGTVTGGREEAQKALIIMRSENLITA